MPMKIDDIEKDLPLLPGYRVRKERPSYHRAQALEWINGVPAVVDEKIKAEPQDPRKALEQNDGKLESPSWLAYDKQVLRFYGHFSEELSLDLGLEKNRTRKVIIYYYLEDNTCQVSEPRVPNSGLAQGTLVRRHRIPLNTESSQYFTAHHFNVGKTVTIYNKTFTITGCDEFTRQFFINSDTNVPENLETPPSSSQSTPASVRHFVSANCRISPPACAQSDFRKFLQNDGHVLRFNCIWDDRSSPLGVIHKMVLNYYLADDTIEVRERTTGHATTQFLRRHRIPKGHVSVAMDGSNLSGAQSSPDTFYRDTDLKIGNTIQIYGRPFLLCECDENTKRHFYQKFSQNIQEIPMDLYDHVDASGSVILKKIEKVQKEPEKEDENEITIIPTGKHNDHKKMGVDDTIVLRFAAKMKTEHELHKQRKFILNFYYVDDTFMIFEKPLPNSGLPGRKFLERSPVKKPGLKVFYGPSDLYEGAELQVCGRTFVLTEADLYSKDFAAEHRNYMPALASQHLGM